MATTYKISIPEPCAENWNEMTPTEQGKFCSKCATNVIDFSVMTDQEIVAYLKNNKSKTCGRFASAQLNRKISNFQSNNWLYKIAASLFLASTTQVAAAQEAKIHHSEVNAANNQATIEQTNEQTATRIIKGTILDDKDNPLEFASVTITNSETSVFSDENGYFEITIEPLNTDSSINLLVEYYGYKTEKLSVSTSLFQPLIIKFISVTEDYLYETGGPFITRKRWWQFWK